MPKVRAFFMSNAFLTPSDAPNPLITFDRGTLLIERVELDFFPLELADSAQMRRDDRVGALRALGCGYRELVLWLHRQKIPFEDKARAFEKQEFPLAENLTPRPHQKKALEAWLSSGKKGVVVMPTGSGKTLLAVMAIAAAARPTLVHVPTLDLMQQWYSVLKKYFGIEPGLVGGGSYEVQDITVSTYDSALIHVERLGARFGLHIYDECHHLPGAQTQLVALQSLAPFRLGLTATPERTDGSDALYDLLTGSPCYEITVQQLEGQTLAPYDVVTLPVELSEEEREKYEQARATYLQFVRQNGITFSSPSGWGEFLKAASRSRKGREALAAYRVQKNISLASAGKLQILWQLLRRHSGERVLVFTQDNAMAYRIGERFLLPVLTHHTKVKERADMLMQFRQGTYSALVTSKVLNEGVDVPEASIAIVVSGSGTVREHVQRLGRVLRASPGKKAILYELVSEQTGETSVNERRKQHSAYERSHPGAQIRPQIRPAR
jgi:superfamily II DNA or RNA helicase